MRKADIERDVLPSMLMDSIVRDWMLTDIEYVHPDIARKQVEVCMRLEMHIYDKQRQVNYQRRLSE